MPDSEQRLFTQPGAWSGGHYEIDVQLRASQLPMAVAALWQFPQLDGCYSHRDREPSSQARLDPAAFEAWDHRLGVATFSSFGAAACLSFTSQDDGDDASLLLCLPLGSLGSILPVGGFPFGRGTDPGWREVVDEWLASLGRHLFEHVAFDLAVIGFEISV